MYLLLVLEILAGFVVSSSQMDGGSEERPCSEGFCVPFYLCQDGQINLFGKGIIDTRFGGSECPQREVCCREPIRESSREEECPGTCVPFNQCPMRMPNLGGKDIINLRIDSGCPGELVCCPLQEEPVKCKCVAFYQCLDIDTSTKNEANSVIDNCTGDDVCCTNIRPSMQENPIVVQSSCKGTCVPVSQCPLNSERKDLVDLRYYDDCPNDQVCCDTPKLETPEICNGKCVPFGQCPAVPKNTDGKGRINPRGYDGLCPGDQVCCEDILKLTVPSTMAVKANCNGTCVPFSQCLKETRNTDGRGFLNPRGYDDACPRDLVCCTETKQHNRTQELIETQEICDGKCVPFGQCPAVPKNTDGKGRINPRAYDGLCPGDQVCCKDTPGSTVTSGKIVETNCNGTCVPFSQCPKGIPNTDGRDILHSRGYDDACPGDLVCCAEHPPTPELIIPKPSCNGSCVEQHNQTHELPCSEGLCVPLYLCQDNMIKLFGEGILDIRTENRECPEKEVCCREPIRESSGEGGPVVATQEICDGKCVPFGQCPAVPKNTDGKGWINPRGYDGLCPGDQVCCKDTPGSTVTSDKIVKANCNGTCVPFSQCPKGSPNTDGRGILNPRGYDDACPGNLVCCTETKTLLTPELIIPKASCKGMCVPWSQCSSKYTGQGFMNLIRFDSACVGELVCCEKTIKMSLEVPATPTQSCTGTCVPLNQCSAERNEVNTGDCPSDLVCCKSSIRTKEHSVMWTNWVTDTNNMVENNPHVNRGQCQLQIDPNTDFVRQQEVPWLVTVWSNDEYRCVGSLIRSDAVLVPADCVANSTQLHVRSGNYNLKSTLGIKDAMVTHISTHPDYDSISRDANVALIFLALTREDVHPATACISDSNDQLNECFLIGWTRGDLQDASNPVTLPRKYRVNLRSPCPSNSLCIAARNPFNQNCDNLHGAPLICSTNQTGQRWKLAGLVSKNNARCDATTVPESLVKVGPQLLWIQEQLSPSFTQQNVVRDPSRAYLPVL